MKAPDQRAAALRVELVSESASPLRLPHGGRRAVAGEHIAALAESLARAGAEVTVHTRRDAPDLPDSVDLRPGVTVRHIAAGPARPLPPGRLLSLVGVFGRGLEQAWRERTPDIVHAHFWRSGLAALQAGRAHDVPVVQSFHGLGAVKRRHRREHELNPPERAILERGIMREAHRILAACSEEAAELLREGADRGRITTVPHAVDTACFGPDGPREYRTSGRPRAVYAGSLARGKGAEDAVRAVAMTPDAELVFAVASPPRALDAEDEPEADRLMDLAAELGVAHRVSLRRCGGGEATATLIRSADVAVCTPWLEPFSTEPLQAMACGVPVVVAGGGGIADAVVDGVTGVHVPARHPPRMAEALAGLLDDEPLRDRMSAAGIQHVRRHHDWDGIGRATARAYERVLAERAPWSPAPSGMHAEPTAEDPVTA